MAEAYETKLVISADTSDAEKKLKDVGKTKVDPVKVDVVAEKVKVDAPKVDPVKVPVSAEKISIDAPKVDPVKVPVSAEKISIDAPKVEPVKVPVSAEKISIDAPKVEPVKVPVIEEPVGSRVPRDRDPIKIPVEVETPTVTAKVETPVVEPQVKTPEPVKATVIEPQPVTPKVVQPEPIKPTVETPTVTAKVETPVVTPVVKTPEPVKATVIEPQPVTPKVVQPEPIKPEVETPTVTAKVETPVVTPQVKTPEPVKATVIEPQPVTPKVNAPEPIKPIELTVGIKDEEAKRRLAEITSLHEIPCKPVGVSAKDGEKFLVEFQPDDTKVVNALREVTSREHVVIVGMRANYEDAQRLYKELSTPVEKPVKVVEKREETPAKEHKAESVRVTEKRDPPKEVKHKDETVNVKANVETPKPVKVPVEQTPKRLKVKADADAVKVPVEQPAPVKIRTFFDSTGLGKVSNALHGIRELANKVMSAFGLFGFVAGIVMSAVAAFNALKTKIDETRNAAKRLQDEFAKSRIDERIKREASSFEALNKALAETNRLEKERNDILAGRRASERTLEDANAEVAKQREIAALDPNATDYQRQKADVERKYEEKSIETRRIRAGEDNRVQANDLYRQAGLKEKDANALQAEADRRAKTSDLAQDRSWATYMRARSGKEEDIKAHEEAEKAAHDAFDAWKKVDDEIKKLRGEAQSLRNRAGELTGGNLAANREAEAERQRLANAEREKEAERQKGAEAAKKEDADWKERNQRTENRRETERYVAANENPDNQRTILEAKAEEERLRAESLRAQYDRELEARGTSTDPDADRRLADLRAKIDDAVSTSNSYSDRANEIRKASNLDRISQVEAAARRVAGFDAVSQNRLTAMGLGSGVTAQGKVTTQMNDIVKLLREEIAAIRQIKLEEASDVAVYGE